MTLINPDVTRLFTVQTRRRRGIDAAVVSRRNNKSLSVTPIWLSHCVVAWGAGVESQGVR